MKSALYTRYCHFGFFYEYALIKAFFKMNFGRCISTIHMSPAFGIFFYIYATSQTYFAAFKHLYFSS